MALLVTDNGEIDSLRNLLNYNQQIPRNLILKLFTTNTTPGESDTPSQTAYWEPYKASNILSYDGAGVVTGYHAVVNNRTDQDYSQQFGILLNGSRWDIDTKSTYVTQQTATGASGEYTITLSAANNAIKKGDYVTQSTSPASAAAVGTGAYVVDIDGAGTVLLLSVKNTGAFTTQSCDFGKGRTTASYPEQTFTFDGPAGEVYGYMLVRANNLPVSVHGVADAGEAAAGTQIAKSGVRGNITNTSITLAASSTSTNVTGANGAFQVTVSDTTALAANQRLTITDGTAGITAGTRIVGIDGTNVTLTKPLTAALTAKACTAQHNVAEDLTTGMTVSHSPASGPNGFDSDTVIVGIDRETEDTDGTVTVFLNKALIDNIQPTNNNDTVNFNYSKCEATAHSLVVGDTIFIAQGTSNTTTTSKTYTVDTVIDANNFTTTPALDGTGKLTLYSAIFFAERFTNGPYEIQNQGDQIKVTLNVSLD